MASIHEYDVEQLAINLLKKQGYRYLLAEPQPGDRENFSDVVLRNHLKAAIDNLNSALPATVKKQAMRQLLSLTPQNLLESNEMFHQMLVEGVAEEYHKNGETVGAKIRLIDFTNPQNNDFVVCNQFTVVENNIIKRPDIVLFVNGIPLVVIELKNPADKNATIKTAYQQLEAYKQSIPSLFVYNALLVISDGLEAKVGSLSAGLTRFMAWKTADGRSEASHLTNQLETLIKGMLNQATLLDLVRHFTVFERSARKARLTGAAGINTVKKIAAYHQYYAVNAAVESTLRAANSTLRAAGALVVKEKPSAYGLLDVAGQPRGDRKAGVVWHTQGSGKSLSMLFYAGKVVLTLDNPTLLIITDRNDLDDQLFDTFAAGQQLLRQKPQQAESCRHLKELLRVTSGGVIFTTIQKFQPDEGNEYETLSERKNIVVIVDEAHRTQYGFSAKTVDNKNSDGQVIGKKVVYGFAKYLRDALPGATYLGFTGTPIENADVNTPAVFGNYVDVYDIAQAVKDGATVRIYYESRLAKVALSDEGRKLVAELDDELHRHDLNATYQAKDKWTQMEALVGSRRRVENIARDIVGHFEARQEVFAGKGMIVCMSRRIAADLYGEIIKLKPAWHSDDLNKGAIKVVITASSGDGPQLAKHHTTKQNRRLLAERMKNDRDPLKLVVVCDMWLTGFDVPNLHTMYIDKPMKGHSLMQAIARVNRVYKDKPGGLVVDYLGIASDLKEALAFYSDAGGKGDPALMQERAVEVMLEKIEVVSAMYREAGGFAYQPYFAADTARKLSLILAAEEHVLGLEDGRKRYINEVTALSHAFAIAVPHDRTLEVKDEVAFFQAVKARLLKFDSADGGTADAEVETTIRQVIDQALVSERVIDVFDAAGIKKPDISILSDEFLAELKNYRHKNVAVEVLKKILGDELKARAKTNLVKSKSLMEMLNEAIRKYHNKILTSAEVIDELIAIGKNIVASGKEAQEMGLSEFEYAFYTAVADNDSAKELMRQDKLRELAVVLTREIRSTASIDWQIKANVQAELRVAVKRLLRKYGYPPDMQSLATETVLQQAEMIATELVNRPPVRAHASV